MPKMWIWIFIIVVAASCQMPTTQPPVVQTITAPTPLYLRATAERSRPDIASVAAALAETDFKLAESSGFLLGALSDCPDKAVEIEGLRKAYISTWQKHYSAQSQEILIRRFNDRFVEGASMNVKDRAEGCIRSASTLRALHQIELTP